MDPFEIGDLCIVMEYKTFVQIQDLGMQNFAHQCRIFFKYQNLTTLIYQNNLLFLAIVLRAGHAQLMIFKKPYHENGHSRQKIVYILGG